MTGQILSFFGPQKVKARMALKQESLNFMVFEITGSSIATCSYLCINSSLLDGPFELCILEDCKEVVVKEASTFLAAFDTELFVLYDLAEPSGSSRVVFI